MSKKIIVNPFTSKLQYIYDELGEVGATGPTGPIGPTGPAGTDGTNGIDGADVKNVPAGTIVATDVQAAINELDTKKTTLTDVKNDLDVASAISLAQQSGKENPTNLLSNGDFEAWSAGTSAAPDGFKSYVNGQLCGVDTLSNNLNTTNIFTIGRRDYTSESNYFSGYLSEIRITKGIARWTKAFTVPNRRY